MKIIAIDTATSKFTVAAKDGERTVSTTYNVGMKQSEILLPAIDSVLGQIGITASELDAMAVSSGPGSFTGLRLSFAACKALSLANRTPLYPISTLKAHAYQYMQGHTDFYILPVIDAKQNKFFASCYKNGKEIFPEGDYTLEEIFDELKKLQVLQKNEITNDAKITSDDINDEKKLPTQKKCCDKNSKIIICGPDAELFNERAKNLFIADDTAKCDTSESDTSSDFSIDTNDCKYLKNCELLIINSQLTAEALFDMAEKMIEENISPAEDYDAPVYLRASNAEEKLLEKNEAKNDN